MKTRESNFELLRIISILMVLVLHYFNGGMGGAFNNVVKGSFNYYLMYLVESMCIIAVNIFIIISGYFTCQKKEIKLSKLLSLLILTSLYSVGFYILSIIIGISKFSIKELIYALVPFTYGSKWFIASYVVLSLLAPYINLIYTKLDKEDMKKFILILVITVSIIPTLLPEISYNDHGYGVLSFIMLYIIGSYIRLYYNYDKNILFYISIYILVTLITFGLSLRSENVWEYNFILNIVSAISLFLIFTKIKFESKIVNTLATFSFSVYIIHTEPRISNILYQSILKCNQFSNNNLFLIHMLICILFIYFICIIIEYVRRIIFKMIRINI